MTEALAARTSTRFRLALMVAANAVSRLSPARLIRGGVPFSVPDRLLAVPEDLVGGQAVRGAAIYAGTFTLGGAALETEGRSIFALPARLHHRAKRLLISRARDDAFDRREVWKHTSAQ